MPGMQPTRRHRRGVQTLLTVLLLVLLLGANIGLTYLTDRTLFFWDLTPEALYTPSDKMVETCSALSADATILFCADPDRLLEHYETRYVYILARQLEKKTDRIHVETCDLRSDPTAVNPYKASAAVTISADDVIVSSGGRYRILSASSFWAVEEDAEDETDYYSFNGEYKLATLLLSVTQVADPVVCFTYGHGERVYVPDERRDEVSDAVLAAHSDDRSSFYYLLQNAGLRVVYLDIDREAVPDDCLLVVMDGPTVDYDTGDILAVGGESPLRRLHSFLADRYGAMMLFKDPTAELKALEDFAADWGIAYHDGYYLRETPENALTDAENTRRKLFATLSTDADSVANTIYEEIVSLGTVPRAVVADAGIVTGSWKNDGIGGSSTTETLGYYNDFFTTSEGAQTVRISNGQIGTSGARAMAGISVRSRLDSRENVRYNSYFFGAATTSLTTNDYLDNHAFCNADLLFTTVRFIARTDAYASMELGGTSLNSPIPGGKQLLTVTLDAGGNVRYDEDGEEAGYYRAADRAAGVAWGLVLAVAPVLLAAGVGTVLLVRRRNR